MSKENNTSYSLSGASIDESLFVEPSKKDIMYMHLMHIGKILSNISLLGLIFVMASFFAFLLTGLYYLVLIALTLCSFGLVFLIPGFAAAWSGGKIILDLSSVLAVASPVLGPIVVVSAALSIALMSFDKKNFPTGRIIFTSVMLAFGIIALILVYAFSGIIAGG